MKFVIPGTVMAALLLASPAFAQYSNTGNASTPGASVTKDNQTYRSTKPKKHSASYNKRHHAQAMKANARAKTPKAQTTGSGSSSAPGASINKDETAPKSK